MFVKKVVDCMKSYHFCINIDECTFNISQKIFSIHGSENLSDIWSDDSEEKEQELYYQYFPKSLATNS